MSSGLVFASDPRHSSVGQHREDSVAANRQWIYARKPFAEVWRKNFDLRETLLPEPKTAEVRFAGKNRGKLMVRV
jgi:hypothetical protein